VGDVAGQSRARRRADLMTTTNVVVATTPLDFRGARALDHRLRGADDVPRIRASAL
jgi:hypothetical protein